MIGKAVCSRTGNRRWRPFSLAMLLLIGACNNDVNVKPPTATTQEDSASSIMPDDIFAQVELGSLDESPASPQVEDDFQGIRIALPERLVLGQSESIPLCGTWTLGDDFISQFENVEDSFVFLIRNMETGTASTGHFRWHEDPADPPDDELQVDEPDDEDVEVLSFDVTGWFNFDLARVWDVPSEPATYQIQVILKEYQSNAAEFSVVEPAE